jgi:DNA polymerase III subunit chi
VSDEQAQAPRAGPLGKPRTIEFHSRVADKLQHAQRLLRKATARGARVAVVGEPAWLRELDAQLWIARPQSFVAHVRVDADQAAMPARMQRTPVWLVTQPAAARACDVLVNGGVAVPTGFDAFARVIDLVGVDDDERATGRLRWRHYESLGFTLENHFMDQPQSGAQP